MLSPKILIPISIFMGSCFLHYPIPFAKSGISESHVESLSNNGLNIETDTIIGLSKTYRIAIGYPSASAGIIINNNWWILGDDAQNLLCVTSQRTDSPYLYYPLPFIRETKDLTEEPQYRRIKKASKMDFEALAHFANTFNSETSYHIWAFGSGSKSPQRDTGLYWNFENSIPNPNKQPDKINLSPLYEFLQRQTNINAEDWNIEGACIDPRNEGVLYLLNRKPAVLISLSLRDWFRYLEIGSLPLGQIEISPFTLPVIDGYKSGFSGATMDTARNSIWFSSSVEVTDNSVNDGTILGSFIGEISLSTKALYGRPFLIPEEPFSKQKTKLESISLQASDKSKARIFRGTVDNDNGGSQLLIIEAQLRTKN